MAHRIRERRKELNLSQDEVAEHCKVTQQAIQQLEDGDVLRPRYLDELAEILKTSKEWIKTGRGEKHIENPTMKLTIINKEVNHSLDDLSALYERSSLKVKAGFYKLHPESELRELVKKTNDNHT